MSRSVRKGPFLDPKLMKKVAKARRERTRGAIRTWARASVIMPEMVGLTFAVHNGRTFIPVLVTENMVGHRLGEFAATRVFRSHSGNR